MKSDHERSRNTKETPKPGGKSMEQLPRAQVKRLLEELGISEMVAQATKGHEGSTAELARMAKRDSRVRDALLLLQPRRNPANAKRREWVSRLEQAGRLSNGSIHVVQGGLPGLKKR